MTRRFIWGLWHHPPWRAYRSHCKEDHRTKDVFDSEKAWRALFLDREAAGWTVHPFCVLRGQYPGAKSAANYLPTSSGWDRGDGGWGDMENAEFWEEGTGNQAPRDHPTKATSFFSATCSSCSSLIFLFHSIFWKRLKAYQMDLCRY